MPILYALNSPDSGWLSPSSDSATHLNPDPPSGCPQGAPFVSGSFRCLVGTMGAIKLAVADGVMTFGWVFCASTLGATTMVIASMLGLREDVLPWASLAITTALVFVLVTIFDVIGNALGGASFNPTATASFYAAGVGSDDLLSMALRFPAQVSHWDPKLLFLGQ